MRRSYQRFLLALTFEVDGRPLGKTRNVSLGGALVKTVLRPPVGTLHQVALALDSEKVECDAQVVRHTHDGIAVAFHGKTPSFERALARVLGPQAAMIDSFKPE